MTEVGSGDEIGYLIPHGHLLFRDVPQSEFPVQGSAQEVPIILEQKKIRKNIFAIDNITMGEDKERQIEGRERENVEKLKVCRYSKMNVSPSITPIFI